jgi:hypothetical protein
MAFLNYDGDLMFRVFAGPFGAWRWRAKLGTEETCPTQRTSGRDFPLLPYRESGWNRYYEAMHGGLATVASLPLSPQRTLRLSHMLK